MIGIIKRLYRRYRLSKIDSKNRDKKREVYIQQYKDFAEEIKTIDNEKY